jgi:hypothetical protein
MSQPKGKVRRNQAKGTVKRGLKGKRGKPVMAKAKREKTPKVTRRTRMVRSMIACVSKNLSSRTEGE